MDCSCVECQGTLGLRGAVCDQTRQVNRTVTSTTAKGRALPIVVLSRSRSRAGLKGVRVMRSVFPLEIQSPIDTKPPPTPPFSTLTLALAAQPTRFPDCLQRHSFGLWAGRNRIFCARPCQRSCFKCRKRLLAAEELLQSAIWDERALPTICRNGIRES
jgi:hypothetical protein